jgi:hypothetical protein
MLVEVENVGSEKVWGFDLEPHLKEIEGVVQDESIFVVCGDLMEKISKYTPVEVAHEAFSSAHTIYGSDAIVVTCVISHERVRMSGHGALNYVISETLQQVFCRQFKKNVKKGHRLNSICALSRFKDNAETYMRVDIYLRAIPAFVNDGYMLPLLMGKVPMDITPEKHAPPPVRWIPGMNGPFHTMTTLPWTRRPTEVVPETPATLPSKENIQPHHQPGNPGGSDNNGNSSARRSYRNHCYQHKQARPASPLRLSSSKQIDPKEPDQHKPQQPAVAVCGGYKKKQRWIQLDVRSVTVH